MFEIGIFSVTVLAVSYWAILWVMGRREDVLHGEFVEGKAQGKAQNGKGQNDKAAPAVALEPAVRPVFPVTPAISERPVFPERIAVAERLATPKRPMLPEGLTQSHQPVLARMPVETAAQEQSAFRPERMEQLLASIKQDLNQLVQK